MKVLFDHQSFSRQGFGGVSRSFVELCRAINQIPDASGRIFAPVHWNEYLRAADVRAFASGVYQRKAVFRLWQQRWWFNHCLTTAYARCFRPDILHETWYTQHPYKLPPGTISAITVHDLIYQIHPDWTNDAQERNQQLAASVDRADIIFCDSMATRNDLLEWRPSIPESKTVVVHLGVGSLSTDEFVGDTGLLSGNGFILYVGQRSTPNKNFRALARAFAASGLAKDTSLLCFGGGAFTDAEIGFFRELGLQENQIIQQSGDDRALAAAYSRALALVYPSLYEGFGLPPLEAMAHGCPVTSSNASCLTEIGGDACLYFDPEDIEQMADALQKVCYDSTLREDLIRKGTERARLFTWEKSARAALAAYQSVL
jgi:glycosyltransferase involved in cell wall biosynthesis